MSKVLVVSRAAINALVAAIPAQYDPLTDGVSIFQKIPADFFSLKTQLVDRNVAEVDASVLQLIPYVVVFNSEDNTIFGYSRGKKGGEGRLHAKYSIGLGGHIESEPTPFSGLAETLALEAMRELNEEIGLDATGDQAAKLLSDLISNSYLVYNDVDEVGSVHLGIVVKVGITAEQVAGLEEGVIERGQFWQTSDLYEAAEAGELHFENWSRITFKNYLVDKEQLPVVEVVEAAVVHPIVQPMVVNAEPVVEAIVVPAIEVPTIEALEASILAKMDVIPLEPLVNVTDNAAEVVDVYAPMAQQNTDAAVEVVSHPDVVVNEVVADTPIELRLPVVEEVAIDLSMPPVVHTLDLVQIEPVTFDPTRDSAEIEWKAPAVIEPVVEVNTDVIVPTEVLTTETPVVVDTSTIETSDVKVFGDAAVQSSTDVVATEANAGGVLVNETTTSEVVESTETVIEAPVAAVNGDMYQEITGGPTFVFKDGIWAEVSVELTPEVVAELVTEYAASSDAATLTTEETQSSETVTQQQEVVNESPVLETVEIVVPPVVEVVVPAFEPTQSESVVEAPSADVVVDAEPVVEEVAEAAAAVEVVGESVVQAEPVAESVVEVSAEPVVEAVVEPAADVAVEVVSVVETPTDVVVEAPVAEVVVGDEFGLEPIEAPTLIEVPVEVVETPVVEVTAEVAEVAVEAPVVVDVLPTTLADMIQAETSVIETVEAAAVAAEPVVEVPVVEVVEASETAPVVEAVVEAAQAETEVAPVIEAVEEIAAEPVAPEVQAEVADVTVTEVPVESVEVAAIADVVPVIVADEIAVMTDVVSETPVVEVEVVEASIVPEVVVEAPVAEEVVAIEALDVEAAAEVEAPVVEAEVVAAEPEIVPTEVAAEVTASDEVPQVEVAAELVVEAEVQAEAVVVETEVSIEPVVEAIVTETAVEVPAEVTSIVSESEISVVAELSVEAAAEAVAVEGAEVAPVEATVVEAETTGTVQEVSNDTPMVDAVSHSENVIYDIAANSDVVVTEEPAAS